MKKLFLATLLLLSVLPLSAHSTNNQPAKPLLVGHRGSGYGVESTEEAFRNGAALGYQYLETDIKVTKDTKFVLTHDDDLSRLSDSELTIAGSTLAQLQAVTLTQTRNNVQYTGKLMELGEYLDLCTELKVLPVIELKWGTGVNSNDQSNMPALVKVIQDHGYYEKAIILTSMKPCLEWLHKNHPTIQLQLLLGSSGVPANHLEWCKTNNADVDFEASICTEAAVDMYHEAGLKVNMWTSNTESGYKTYATMGCDFITTDRLDGNNLPEYDPRVIIPIITGDYPDPLANSILLPAESYTFHQAYTDNALQPLEGKTIRRVIAQNNHVYILALDAENKPTILVVDLITKTHISVSTMGMVKPTKVNKADEARLLACSDIQVSQDGYLLATNLAETNTNGTGEVTIYKWEKDAAGLPTGDPAVWIRSQANGTHANAYTGETFAYAGTIEKGNAYLSAEVITSTATVRFAVVPIIDSTATPRAFSHSTPPGRGFMKRTTLGDGYRFTLSPIASDRIIVTGSGKSETLAEFPFVNKGATSSEDVPASLDLPTSLTHINFFKYAGAIYATVPTANGVTLLDISNGIENATIVNTIGTTLAAGDEVIATVGQVYATFSEELEVVTRGDIDLFLLRGNKASVLTTRESQTTHIETTTQADKQVVYFDIMGNSVATDQLTTGVYIRRQGNQATKILIP